jgi:AmmeMemoRadiSam system protein A
MGAYERIEALDPAGFLAYQRETGATVCGFRPIALLLHLLPKGTGVRLVAYDTSGAQQGDYRHSVSYLAIAFTAPAEPAAGASLQWLHRLAVLGVRRAVEADGAVDAEIERLLGAAPADVLAPAGAFVTLRNGGKLRGCIGYVAPIKPTWEAVLENAAAAAVRDPRFPPVSARDLPLLEVEVSVLTEPIPIADWQALEVGRDGILLEKDGRRAVFLPEVAAQQGWGREETLTRLAMKAGLPADAWRKGARLAVFASRTIEAPLMASATP